VLVEQSPVATMLLRSLLVDFLDVAERALPVLTPDEWRDTAPRMGTGVRRD
jgi:nitrous oxidase accessory protein